MPITLNHSNIGVQYSSDKSYIIETVKSDLYRRNENYDNIIRDNLQTAPVTPSIYIENGTNNIYAVESYTYSGSANTADFTRVFPKNTTGDILVIGGGGAGGTGHGGGGGGGSVIYTTGLSFEGEYNIKVGKGGIPAATRVNNGGNGNDSFVVKNGTNLYLAKGGGGGGFAAPSSVGSDGGSGGGGQGNATTGVGGLAVSTNIPTGVYGFAGGRGNTNGSIFAGGGGGGGETIGSDAVVVNTSQINGGNGGNGKQIPITGNSLRYGGGGGGGVSSTGVNNIVGNGGLGGGGNGGLRVNGFTGTDGLGGGGGGGGQDANGDKIGGTGGSGIVIIRYLLGTIPGNNLLTNEPVVSPYVIVADGYYPRTPATNSATWTDIIYNVNVKVSDAPLSDNQDFGAYKLFNNNIISDDCYHSKEIYTTNGTTYNGTTRFKGDAGIAIGIDLGRPIYPNRIKIAPRADYPGLGSMIGHAPSIFKIYASNNPSSWNDNNHSDWVLIHSQASAATFVNLQYTIITLSNIPSISYRYYTMVVLSVISRAYLVLAELGIGGYEKIDAIPEGNPITHKRLNFVYNSDNLVAWYKFNGDYLDSSGNGHNLTNVGTVIQSTHIIEGQAVEFDSTDYLEFPSTINPYTIWNGKGITFSFWVRFTSITGTYSRFIDFQSGASGASGIFFAFKAGTDAFYLNCAGTTLTYSNSSIITTLGVWHHIVWSIDITGKWDLYLNNVRINNTETSAVPNITYNLRYINKSTYPGNGVWGGQMDDFRIYSRAISAADVASLYNKTYPVPSNTYTLNFQVPTIADINNNSNIVLRGAYDIALSTSNAVIIPKAGQYIPKPTTFTNYTVERMYPPVRNFTAATTAVSGQTYGNGTYVVSYSSTFGSGGYEPFKCFNTSDGVGGHWLDNRYTAGVFNSTSFIVEGYLGDWLKIQLPVAIKLTRFEFKIRPDFLVRAPKDFKIYGSNDNITWVELVNKTDAVYNSSNKYEQATPEITNTYTYYGLVVNKIFTGQYDVTLNFDEWYIYGQELLPSSLSLRYHLLNPVIDPIGAQWTYSSNNTNVYHMGRVGIGTTNPEYQLDVRGFIFTSAGGYTQTGSENWVVQSDRRIKENIVKASYEKCLDNVKKIELYNFNFKDNCVNTNDKNQLGFIAQEVQQVYPKAVEVGRMTLDNNQGINDLLTLNTTQIKYTLYGAVKNLIERVENIESRVEQIYNMTLSSNIKSSSSNISITFITPLTPNITTNTSNITANTSNITTNTSNVSTNSSNISTNTSNITTNTSNITANSSNITTNTSNI